MPNNERTKMSWITRTVADTINCAALYARTKENLLTSNVTIRVAAGMKELDQMVVRGAAILVPNTDKPFSDFCEEPWNDFCVHITYSQDGYLPDDLMTRAEFVIQTLNIWEAMQTRMQGLNKTVADELEIAAAYLRSVYTIPELIDMQSTITEIGAIVVPPSTGGSV